MDADLHLAVYRILQEHLTNILKHAQAHRVTVDITHSKHMLSMEILDDGDGFDVRDRRHGIGITNMISRAESLGGGLEMITSPGNGCMLRVKIPMLIQ